MTELTWIAEARKHVGLKEVKGIGNNPIILSWLDAMGNFSKEDKAWWSDDSTPWCLTGDIEVLTSDGFVRLDQVDTVRPKKVAQLNTNTLEIEYVETYKYIEKKYDGEIYNVKCGVLNFSCDPKHKLFGSFSSSNVYKLREISKMKGFGIKIPNVKTSAIGLPITDDEIIFLAAFLSDGCIPSTNKVRFGFSKQRKIDLIEKFDYLSKKIENKVYGVSNKPITRYTFDISMLRKEYLKEYKKVTDEFIYGLSAHQAKVFIDTYGKFDGTLDDCGSFELFTACKDLQESLLMIATFAGYKATPYSTKQVSVNSKVEYLHNVYVSQNKHRCLKPTHITKTDYSGKLYCLSVPSAVMIIRCRNGVIIPIGNCGVYTGYVLGVSDRFVVKNWFRASAWNDSTNMTKLVRPAYGCIVTFTRKGGGHVGFVVGRDAKGNIMVLGGNQGDRVSIIPFGNNRNAQYYWPSIWSNGKCVKSVPAESRYILPLLQSNGKVSTNEG